MTLGIYVGYIIVTLGIYVGYIIVTLGIYVVSFIYIYYNYVLTVHSWREGICADSTHSSIIIFFPSEYQNLGLLLSNYPKYFKIISSVFFYQWENKLCRVSHY